MKIGYTAGRAVGELVTKGLGMMGMMGALDVLRALPSGRPQVTEVSNYAVH